MKISSILALAIATATIVATAAEMQAPGPGRRKGGKPTGGFIEVPQKSKVIQIVNDGGCDDRLFANVKKLVETSFSFPVTSEAVAKEGARDSNSVARVTLVSKDGSPILLCAPDEGWAVVNVKPLLADNPNEFAFRQRVQKETMRAMAYALGCGNSSARPCLMSEAETLTQLDALPKTYGPEPMAKTAHTARTRGAVARKFVSYRIACEQGWAAAPTNDVQKAIWDEVHAMPTEPIKIKPETKKVSE